MGQAESKEAQLKEVVADTLGIAPDDIDEETSTETQGAWTSLNHLTLMATVEEAFGVTFTMEEMTALTNYAALRDAIVGSAKR